MMRSFLVTIAILCLAISGFSQPGRIDQDFNPTDPGFGNGLAVSGVNAMQWTSDGRCLAAGGRFNINQVSRRYLAMLMPDGSIDESLNLSSASQYASIYSTAILPDQSILIGGYFDSIQGVPRKNFARIFPDGSLDTSFPDLEVNGLVMTIGLQSDGKILIGGTFSTVDGLSRSGIARINSNGSPDNTFLMGTGFSDDVNELHVLEDDKILVAGYFQTYNGNESKRLIRLHADGSYDNTFAVGSGFNYAVYTVRIDNDGNYCAGGYFNTYQGESVKRFVRLFPDGTRDTSFLATNEFGYEVNAILVQADGKLVISGDFSSFAGSNAQYIVRVHPDGTLDETFDTGEGLGYNASCMLQRPDGELLLGNVYSYNDVHTGGITKVSLNGELDLDYYTGSGASSFVHDLKIDAAGNLILAGEFTRFNNAVHRRLVRVHEDGSADASFNPSFNDIVYAVEIQDDGKILAGGLFSEVNGVFTGNLVRLNSDGSIDETFANDPDLTYYPFQPGILDIDIQSDGKILVAGEFSYNLLRFNPDGSQDLTFDPGDINYGVFQAEELLDGHILITGDFSTIQGSYEEGRAFLLPDGTLDELINISLTYPGNFAQWPDGRIQFKSKRFFPDGSLDNTYAISGLSGSMKDIVLMENGKMLMAGIWSNNQGVLRNLIRLNHDGSEDINYSGIVGANDDVLTLEASGSKIYLGGEFTSIDGIGRNRIARVYNGNLSYEEADVISICREDSFTVSYFTDEFYEAGNAFQVELSDVNGAFTNPLVIGSAQSTIEGSILAVIPADLEIGTGYRYRVVSTQPYVLTLPSSANTNVTDVDTTLTQFGNTIYCNELGATYQWYDCIGDSLIPGATSYSFSPAVNGSYAAYIEEDGCSGMTACTVFPAVGVQEEIMGNGFAVYPVPATDEVTFQYPEKASEAVLFDANGRLVDRISLPKASSFTYPLSKLIPGSYFLEFRDGRDLLARRKVICH